MAVAVPVILYAKAVLGKMVPACLNHLDEAARQELRVELVNSLESVENFSA